ncbi:MAG: hypothetical protein C5B53_12825 [Candidatus Melainabacteria bacterium]|nr:MAG: hypothetical protein C5B53_12825 [Candidatus Melainabacteria bacterium]
MNSRAWLIVLILFYQLAPTPAWAADQAWALEQFSDISGDISLIWTNDRVRADFKKYGLVFISKAPAWRVVVYSDTTKRYCECSLEEFRTRFGQRQHRLDPSDRVLKTDRTAKIAGLNSRLYILIHAKKTGKLDWTDKSEVWLTKEVSVPPSIAGLFAEVASLSPQLGVPLRAFRIRNRGMIVRTIDTVAYHKVAIKPNAFSSPKGYTKVSDEVAVLMEEDMDTLIEQQAGAFSSQPVKGESNACLKANQSR